MQILREEIHLPSAFIEVISQKDIPLELFSKKLVELTRRKSGGFQAADIPSNFDKPDWNVAPTLNPKNRIALKVLVISDYSKLVLIKLLESLTSRGKI